MYPTPIGPHPYTCVQPPAEATQSLSKLVNEREGIDETVVAYLLSDILKRTESLTDRKEEYLEKVLSQVLLFSRAISVLGSLNVEKPLLM